MRRSTPHKVYDEEVEENIANEGNDREVDKNIANEGNVEEAEDAEDPAEREAQERLMRLGKDAIDSQHESFEGNRQLLLGSLDELLKVIDDSQEGSQEASDQLGDTITVEDCRIVLRAMGYCGSDVQLNALIRGDQSSDEESNDTEQVSVSRLREVIAQQQGVSETSSPVQLRRLDAADVTESVRFFESKFRPGHINISELGYLLNGPVGLPLTNAEYEKLLVDLDFDPVTGLLPSSTLLYFFGGEGGSAPSGRRAAAKRKLAQKLGRV